MGSLAMVTQLLSMCGILADINMIVWLFGLTTIGSAVTFASGLLAVYAYDQAYKVTVGTSYSVAKKAAAANVMAKLESEMLRGSVEAFMVNR